MSTEGVAFRDGSVNGSARAPMTESIREQLRKIIGEHSVLRREGGFLLASGKRSDFYIDLKRTTLSMPNALRMAARIILDRVNALPGRIDAIGGLTSGADPLVIAVSQMAVQEGQTLPGFFVRDRQKEHGTEREIEGTVEAGMRVVILDDVITTGKSVLRAIGPAAKAGATVAKVFILVDREEGGLENLRALGHSVEPIFTVSELKACGAVSRASS